jgi:predicted ArsR family transcriptional regulator
MSKRSASASSHRPKKSVPSGKPSLWGVRQWRAISSPIRLELLALAEAEQPCSIGDLARASGRRATGLYRHVRIFVAAGLLVPDGKRPGVRRPEQLYRVSPLAGRFRAAVTEERSAERYVRVEMAALRACGRGLRDMLREHFRTKGPTDLPPRFHARHEITWLDDERSKKLGQIVKSLEKIIEEGRRDRRGVPHQIDLLIWRRRVFEPAAPAKRRPAAKKATRRTNG